MIVRMTRSIRRPELPRRTKKRARKRWRFRPHGLIGIILTIVIAINLFVLADNIVNLARLHVEKTALNRRLAQKVNNNRALRQQRDRMKGTDFLRNQAYRLGYTGADETASTAAGEVPQGMKTPFKKRRQE